MGRSCVVKNCPKNTILKSGDTTITYHRFPKNEELKKKWEAAVNRHDGWRSTKYSVICSLHFESECFKKTTGRVMLLSWAVPSLLLSCDVRDAQPKATEGFNFVPIKTEKVDEEIVAKEAASSFVKVEEQMSDTDFVDIKCEDTLQESSAEGVDPLDIVVMKQEAQDEHSLAACVIEEDLDLAELKEEEIIIDDRQVLMDWTDDEGKGEDNQPATDVAQPICSQDKPISCEICYTKFYDQTLLDSHKKTVHLRCEVCQKSFRNPYSLRTHTIFHKVERQLTCTKCSGSFQWVGSLQQFNMYKDGEKSFLCKQCDVVDNVKQSLTSINLQKNKQTTNKPLSVILAFTVVSKCNEVNPLPTLTCEFCSMKFNTFGDLMTHQSNHTVEKELLCTYCGMVSHWVGTIEQCDKFVSGEEDFMCSSCNADKRSEPNASKSAKAKHDDILPSTSSTTNYICILCKAHFDTNVKLQTHKNSHRVNCQIDCSSCKKVIKYKGSLANLEGCLCGTKNIVCNDCVNSQHLKSLQMQVQFVDAVLACNKCNKLVKWFGELQQLKRYTAGIGIILCDKCRGVNEVSQDTAYSDQLIQTNIKCVSCKSTFKWKGKFMHLNQLTKTNDSILCTLCEKKKQTFQSMIVKTTDSVKAKVPIPKNVDKPKYTVALDKLNSTNILFCQVCRPSSRFDDFTSFIAHIKCHVPIEDFVCTCCNKPGYWGKGPCVADLKCQRCTSGATVMFNRLTQENIIFENKIVDNFMTTPLFDKELECSLCQQMYPWFGNEKQLKELASGVKSFTCLKCIY